jgi:hypothetical protein
MRAAEGRAAPTAAITSMTTRAYYCLLAVLVTAVNVHDKHRVEPLLIAAYEAGWRIKRTVGDPSYGGEDSECAAAVHGVNLRISSRPED